MRKFLMVAIIGIALCTACSTGKKNAVDGAKVREYAADLMNRALFKQAVNEYERYLNDYSVDETEQANITFIVANTYFDRLKNYEEALAAYLKIKHLYPESKLIEQVNKRIIACLERLDRSTDAQQALDETVQADPAKVGA